MRDLPFSQSKKGVRWHLHGRTTKPNSHKIGCLCEDCAIHLATPVMIVNIVYSIIESPHNPVGLANLTVGADPTQNAVTARTDRLLFLAYLLTLGRDQGRLGERLATDR